MVTNVSDGGVRLQIVGAEIPDWFLLTLCGDQSADAGKYKVVWRAGLTQTPNSLPSHPPDAELSY
jgi:hypothetical protein